MFDQELVVGFIKRNGPSIPVQIARELGTNILFASAMLSELVSDKRLRISSVKIGGTPMYYALGQEHMLKNFSKHLHEKEKKAYDILEKEKVMQDSKLQPVVRVSLRSARDFAKPLEVTVNGEKEIFWKWFLLSNDEASVMIKKILGIKEPARGKKVIKEQVKKRVKQKAVKKVQKKRVVHAKTVQKPEKTEGAKEEKQEKIQEKVVLSNVDDTFVSAISKYFIESSISVLEHDLIKKESESDFIIELPSAVGKLKFYCKARMKKRVNDGDLSSAFVQGQLRKLPVLFITSGELTKKASAILEKDFSSMVVKKI